MYFHVQLNCLFLPSPDSDRHSQLLFFPFFFLLYDATLANDSSTRKRKPMLE